MPADRTILYSYLNAISRSSVHLTTSYLLLGGLSSKGATELGKLSRELRYIVNTICAEDDEIELRDLAHHFERIGAEVEQKRLVDVALRRRHPVLVNIPLDVRAELKLALSSLSDDELAHFLPKAHGGETPFTETLFGEQSWYFEGRKEESQRIVDWLDSDIKGLFVVTGRAGSGKSALLGHSGPDGRFTHDTDRPCGNEIGC